MDRKTLKRTLIEVAILFVTTTAFKILQPYFGLIFAAAISIIPLNKNKYKYAITKIILSFSYVITIWYIVFRESLLLSYPHILAYLFWLIIILYTLHLWVNEKLEVNE